ncbi:hypothetical protein [Microbacterium sp. W4I4]|nr:hypothetical protein [Microbacterium sp. W4I4]
MAEKQAPVTETSSLAAPPSLQLLETDAAAGLCTNGYCVLPSSLKASPGD